MLEVAFAFFSLLCIHCALKMLPWGIRLLVQHHVCKMCLMLFLADNPDGAPLYTFYQSSLLSIRNACIKKTTKKTKHRQQYLLCILIARAPVQKTFRDIQKQQQIKHYFHMGRERRGHPRGLAQIVLFIIINSNVILKPPVTSSQQHLISEVIH